MEFFSLEPYTIRRHYSASYKKKVNYLISTKEFDVVHCDILPLCYTIIRRNDIYRSITDHDVCYLKYMSMAKNSTNILLKYFIYLEAWKIRRLEKSIFNSIDLGIVVSDSDKNILQRLCPQGNFLVAANGVDLEKFKPANKNQTKNKLVWIGGFDYLPNKQAVLYFFNRIYPLVKKQVPEVTIDLVGGSVTANLMHFHFDDNSINFAGYVKDPLDFLYSAEIFVAPIISGGGTKLKILEAMALGKAIVTTNAGCAGIEGKDGIHYMVAETPHKFAEHVILLLHNRKKRLSLQRNAMNLINDKYDFKKIVKIISCQYELSLKNPRL